MVCPSWLETAVFYNIYPQSFYDSNGDGIGDLNGIKEKLSYIKDMGYNAVWLNPFYESPFCDAGYDVTNFYKVAPRYGTNEDFAELCKEAKALGIRIAVDLVAGHTSLECEWFKKSASLERNEYSDRYVWTNSVWDKGDKDNFVSGYCDRDGCFLNNFFYCQPALNYGYAHPTLPWQKSMNDPACLATREELYHIMEYWLSLGADGFRVDMAASLVKNDDGHSTANKKLWQDIIGRLQNKYPECAMISEWSWPEHAIEAGFDIDFLIHTNLSAYTTLFRHEDGTNVNKNWSGNSYFRKAGKGDFRLFLNQYAEQYNKTVGKGYISIPSGNHDLPRYSIGRDTADMKTVMAFILTMPGVPFIYYGDEIGMKNLSELPSKEGAYNRTGARTPMQWSAGKNFGFSTCDTTYLPVDFDENATTVERQLADEGSLLNTVKGLIALRKSHPSLSAKGSFRVINDGYPLLYERTWDSETVRVLINPSDATYTLKENAENVLISESCAFGTDKLTVMSRGFSVYTAKR